MKTTDAATLAQVLDVLRDLRSLQHLAAHSGTEVHYSPYCALADAVEEVTALLEQKA